MKTNNKKNVSLIVCVITAALALLGAILWLLPVAKYHGEGITMAKAMKLAGADGMASALGVIVVLYAVSAVWAAIPKKWAAIVGMIYGLLPLVMSIAQVNSWKAARLDLTLCANLMVPVSVCVVVLSLVKLIVLPKTRKVAAPQSPAAM